MLKKLRKKYGQSIDDMEEARITDRLADLGVTKISEAPRRTPVLLAGEVQSLQVVPHAGSPSLEVTFSDGSGRAVAVFTGRKKLSGVACGRRVMFEGVGREQRGRLMVVNPAYTIVE